MNWEKNVRTVVPYVPGEQPKDQNVIKLNTNECPYPPAPGVAAAAKEFHADCLRLYPDADSTLLTESLATYYQVNKEQVFVGVGSDDVLALAFLTFFHSKTPIFFPDVTYSFYDVWADLFRIPYEVKKLDNQYKIVVDDYLTENGGIIIANPNAPTGVLETVENIEKIVKENPDVVIIIDEAYVDFGGTSCLPLVEKYENLLIVQTFSKSRAMAGMRIGFAIGSKKIIKYLQDTKFSFNSYTMNATSLAIGVEAVKDETYFHEIVNKIISTRERTKRELAKLGFEFTDSMGNFIFATHSKFHAKDLFEACKINHIYVRYWNKPRIDNRLRISIGTDEEMNALIGFLKKYMMLEK
ncbi:MAG TPA: histidinol-phosphate transaminase [Lachnospiraceae bacterium]|nr:histidinol-phosphate transaminase [Lachnospiraceae bacterium]